MSKKGEIWSEEECLALLCAWGDEEIQTKLGGTHKNADVYKKISRMMKESGDFDRDWNQCRTKIKHLKTEYKKYKDLLSRSGAGRGKEPKFFWQMDYFLGDKPEALGLEKSVDTSIAPEEDSASIDSDTNLVEKYGNGISVEKHCPKCNEKVEVRTAGVHFGENNCIAVYSDDEKLVCPNCNYTEEVNHQQEETPVKKQKTAKSAGIIKPKTKAAKKDKPTKMQVAFENVMAGYTKYQKESDQMFVSQMKDQFEKEAEIRKEELNAYTASMGLLANAIAGRQQSVQQQQNPHYQIQHDIENQLTYYKL